MSSLPPPDSPQPITTETGDTGKSALIGRARQLLSYLEALYRLRHPRNPDALAGQVLLATGLPDHPAVQLHPEDGVILHVDRLEKPAPISVPPDLEQWVDTERDVEIQPRLRHDRTFADHQAIRQSFDRWIEQVWTPWRASIEPQLAAHRLFMRLYDQRLVAERDLATHESIWVHGMAVGPEAGMDTARLPLFVTPVQIEIDGRSGRLRVLQAGPPNLEIDRFDRLVEAFDLVKQISVELLGDPTGATDPVDDDAFAPVGPLEDDVCERISKVIADATFDAAPDAIPSPAGHWQIINLEGLFHRSRPVQFEAYFKSLGEALTEGYLPDTWSAILADEPTTAPVSQHAGSTGSEWSQLDQRILSPLPLNEQQLSILRRIARSAGVTVQGPPGTGKSYAIAALTSHFLTHGLRVLICAEKPQPLRVIRDKMPEDLQQLCVAVLGDDRAANQQLEASIATITARVNAVDVDRDERRLAEVDDELDRVRRELSTLRSRELDIRGSRADHDHSGR